MKNKLLTLLLFGASLSAVNAQNPLANTAWQGIVNAPLPTDVVFHFSSDSTYMYFMPDNFIGETMTYNVKGDTLTWRKTSGNSPCDTQAVGLYRFAVKGDAMTLTSISDECPAREQAGTSAPFKKVAIPTK